MLKNHFLYRSSKYQEFFWVHPMTFFKILRRVPVTYDIDNWLFVPVGDSVCGYLRFLVPFIRKEPSKRKTVYFFGKRHTMYYLKKKT
jgi:hypothetical protein